MVGAGVKFLLMTLHVARHDVSVAWLKAHFKVPMEIERIKLVIRVFARQIRTFGFEIPIFHLDDEYSTAPCGALQGEE